MLDYFVISLQERLAELIFKETVYTIIEDFDITLRGIIFTTKMFLSKGLFPFVCIFHYRAKTH